MIQQFRLSSPEELGTIHSYLQAALAGGISYRALRREEIKNLHTTVNNGGETKEAFSHYSYNHPSY